MSSVSIDLTGLPDITNSIYYPLYNSKQRYMILFGGAGSGKSVFIADKLVFRCIKERNHRFLVLRKVGNTLKESVYAELKHSIAKFGLTNLCKFNDTEKIIKLPLFNSEIICKGLDDPEKIKSIQGITGIWIEEATELLEDDLKQLDRRIRGETGSYKQIIMSFNPINQLHWIKRKLIDQPTDKMLILKTTYKDNKFLTKDDVDVLESETDKFYYDVYTLGEWGALGNVIFTNYTVEDFQVESIIRGNSNTLYYGIDYGFNDPSAYIVAAIDEDVGEILIFDELYLTGLTNDQLIDNVERIHDKRDLITSETVPERIKEFRERGFNIKSAVKGKGSIKAGVDYLKRFKIRIDKHCQHTINEIQLYKYREDKNGVVYEEPVDKNNHLIDALRYATEDVWRQRNSTQKKPDISRQQVLGW